MSNPRQRKGAFGPARLDVAANYIAPARRPWMLAIVLAFVLALAGVLAFDLLRGPGGIVSSGPLSSSHASLDAAKDCEACHVRFESVVDEQCGVCHEKYGDRLGVYSFNAHYVYRSDDLSRMTSDHREMRCFSCHPEHEGREARITRVPDERCTVCHEYGSFTEAHPAFEQVDRPDDAGLRFPHIRHVREVMKNRNIEDPERACLYCHGPQKDGTGFEAIDFDQHCDTCHLQQDTGTDFLPIRGPDEPFGVETLTALQREQAPGTTAWTAYASLDEFEEEVGFVRKSPVRHRDPWVLENLRRLRRDRFEPHPLADLLVASADPQRVDRRALFREAIATLEQRTRELRSSASPTVQADLIRVDRELERLRRRLEDPYTALDASRFALAIEERDLTEQQAAQIDEVVTILTRPCAEACHVVQDATLERVQSTQRVLHRAEFDHRAHILQRRCLDCHQEIPIIEYLESGEKPSATEDRAEIQNLPGIEICQECHNRQVSSQACVTCHPFHPDPTRRSDLLLYVAEVEDGG